MHEARPIAHGLPLDSAGEHVVALRDARLRRDPGLMAEVLWSASQRDGLAWRRVESRAQRALLQLGMERFARHDRLVAK